LFGEDASSGQHATTDRGIAKLIGSLAWPLVGICALIVLGRSPAKFLSTLSELRLRGGGFEAAATRRLDLDATSQKLHDFRKPGGKIDRANAARIADAMRIGQCFTCDTQTLCILAPVNGERRPAWAQACSASPSACSGACRDRADGLRHDRDRRGDGAIDPLLRLALQRGAGPERCGSWGTPGPAGRATGTIDKGRGSGLRTSYNETVVYDLLFP
jgi:hypothetical protein